MDCCYFCEACVSGLLKIDARETKRVEGVDRRQITQCEAVRRDSSCVCCLISNPHALMIKCDSFSYINPLQAFLQRKTFNRLTPSELLTCKNVNEALGIFSRPELQSEAQH